MTGREYMRVLKMRKAINYNVRVICYDSITSQYKEFDNTTSTPTQYLIHAFRHLDLLN